MTNNEINYNPIRHWNFRQVVNACGGVNEAARILKKTNSNVSQYYVMPPKRSIGDRFAAQIESTFGLKPGDLDLPPPPEAQAEDALLAELSSVMVNTSPDDKKIMIGIAKLFAERNLKKIKPSDL